MRKKSKDEKHQKQEKQGEACMKWSGREMTRAGARVRWGDRRE